MVVMDIMVQVAKIIHQVADIMILALVVPPSTQCFSVLVIVAPVITGVTINTPLQTVVAVCIPVVVRTTHVVVPPNTI